MFSLFPAISLTCSVIPSLESEQASVSCLDWSGVETTKILKDMCNPVILAPQGTIVTTGDHGSHRSTGEWIGDGVHAHNAAFLKHKEVGNNAKSSPRKESRDDHSE